jgi:hypothetical protein
MEWQMADESIFLACKVELMSKLGRNFVEDEIGAGCLLQNLTWNPTDTDVKYYSPYNPPLPQQQQLPMLQRPEQTMIDIFCRV